MGGFTGVSQRGLPAALRSDGAILKESFDYLWGKSNTDHDQRSWLLLQVI